MLKKAQSVLLVVVIAVVAVVSGVVAQHPVYSDLPDLGGRELVIAVENQYAPFQFSDPRADSAIGFDHDLIRELAYRLNFTPVYEVTSWEVQIAAVGEGQFDLGLNGISIKEERRQVVTFSEPYVAVEVFLLVRDDETEIVDLDSFVANSDHKLGVTSGGANYWLAQGYISAGLMRDDQRVVFNGFAEAVQSLVNGDIDAIPADASVAGGFVNASGAPVRIVGDALEVDTFGIIFPLNADPELVAAFDAALQTMRDDGFLDFLAYKWLVQFAPAAAN